MVKKQKKSQLRPRTFKVLEQAVHDGVVLGWNRAFKHDENPSPDMIQDTIRANVLQQIDEWFLFDDEESQ